MEETVNVVPPLPQGVCEAAAAGGLRSNSLAAANAPPLAACEGSLTGALTLADVQRAPPPTVAAQRARLPPGVGRREACGADDATPSVISTSSSWWEWSATRTMETSKR